MLVLILKLKQYRSIEENCLLYLLILLRTPKSKASHFQLM